MCTRAAEIVFPGRITSVGWPVSRAGAIDRPLRGLLYWGTSTNVSPEKKRPIERTSFCCARLTASHLQLLASYQGHRAWPSITLYIRRICCLTVVWSFGQGAARRANRFRITSAFGPNAVLRKTHLQEVMDSAGINFRCSGRRPPHGAGQQVHLMLLATDGLVDVALDRHPHSKSSSEFLDMVECGTRPFAALGSRHSTLAE